MHSLDPFSSTGPTGQDIVSIETDMALKYRK